MNKTTDDKGQAAVADSTRNSELNGALGAWQPIATAPKDGTIVLSYRYGAYTGISWKNGYWVNCHAYRYERVLPTHWMPLPPPPV